MYVSIPGELYVAIPGFGGLGSGDGRTDRLMVWGEHGMVREVYISGHDFCHSFRWYGNEGRAWKGEGGIHFCHDFCHTFSWYEKEGRAWND